MNDKCDIRLDLLLFSACGVHFGIDAAQVAGIANYDGEQSDDLFWFHDELGFGAGNSVYFSPTVVTIRTDDIRPYRVIIDTMEDIAEFSQNDISLFPALLEPFTIRRGVWGILPRNGRMVLLVDFIRLLKEKCLIRGE